MRWFLFGFCALVIINVPAALGRQFSIAQKPRFYGVRPNRFVTIYCASSHQHLPAKVCWFKATRYDQDAAQRQPLKDAMTRDKDFTVNAFLILHDLTLEDSGIYFCRINDTWGSGTQLQVARLVNRAQALRRSNMKDALIVLEGLMLAAIVTLLLQRHRKMVLRRERIYEEPKIEHIYEGLTIEGYGRGDLYEELSVYAEVEDGVEAPWE
ncbi:B-cell antigen receptor complex-associated protein beta chain [Stigmatopora argus]